MGKVVNLKGKIFGSLTVLEESGRDKANRKMWLCECLCGNKKVIASRHLVQGKTVTCGCKIGRKLPKPALGLKGNKHPRWKGGKYINSDGYVMVYRGDGKYVAEHRLITNCFDPKLIVHHKNHNRADNRLDNLEIMTRAEHAKEHNLGVDVRGNR